MGLIQIPSKVPNGLTNAWVNDNNLWIQFVVRKIKHQKLIYLSQSAIETELEGTIFEFLAPIRILEQIGHTWDANSNPATRIGDLIAQGYRTYGLGEDVIRRGQQAVSSNDGLKFLTNDPNISQTKFTRVDSPLMYTNSRNRDFIFDFELIAGTTNEGILNIVKKLEEFSCPELMNGIQIELPYIFSINTRPQGLLNARFAALTSVQPTYEAPFIIKDGGLEPSKISLNLSFVELEPLYRNNLGFNENPRITVG